MSRMGAGAALLLLFACRVAGADPAALYQQHCASCHGPDRFGAMGPALLPESLERLKKADAAKVIASGRPATQMQGFADRLPAEAIEGLVQWIYAPVSRRRSGARRRSSPRGSCTGRPGRCPTGPGSRRTP